MLLISVNENLGLQEGIQEHGQISLCKTSNSDMVQLTEALRGNGVSATSQGTMAVEVASGDTDSLASDLRGILVCYNS